MMRDQQLEVLVEGLLQVGEALGGELGGLEHFAGVESIVKESRCPGDTVSGGLGHRQGVPLIGWQG